MTGYGNASVQAGSKTVSAEIKSVNSKFFDLNLRLPSSYREKELELRTDLGRAIERGKVECTVTVESSEAQKRASFNIELLKAYHQEVKQVQEQLRLQDSPDVLRLLLTMPDVLVTEKGEIGEQEWTAFAEAIQKALAAFDSFRSNEGKVLAKDLQHRIGLIREGIRTLEPFEQNRIGQMRKRMQAGLEEFIQSADVDRNRFEQELIYYIEKLDVTEEKVRLASHLDYFIKTMQETSSGKKLSFIAQEIGREINTIGSKCNDADMQRIVVGMKDELEKVKEQVLNVL
jgi:uncharacterized protein (TIGR00255 family)